MEDLLKLWAQMLQHQDTLLIPACFKESVSA